MQMIKSTWSKDSIPASSCVRLTIIMTSRCFMLQSSLYRISMTIFMIPISTIFSAKSGTWDKFTRASAAGSETSCNNKWNQTLQKNSWNSKLHDCLNFPFRREKPNNKSIMFLLMAHYVCMINNSLTSKLWNSPAAVFHGFNSIQTHTNLRVM